MSNRVKGIIVGGSLSLLAIAIWIFGSIFIGTFGYIVAAALLGIAFILPYKKICPEDKSKFPTITACVIIVVSAIFAELLYWIMLYVLQNTLTAEFFGEVYWELVTTLTLGGFIAEIFAELIIYDMIFGMAIAFIVFGVLQYTLTRKNMRGRSGYTYHTNVNNQPDGGYNNNGNNNGGNYYPGTSQPYGGNYNDPFGFPPNPQNPQSIDPFADAPGRNNNGNPPADKTDDSANGNNEGDAGTKWSDPAEGGTQWFDRSGDGKQWFEKDDNGNDNK